MPMLHKSHSMILPPPPNLRPPYSPQIPVFPCLPETIHLNNSLLLDMTIFLYVHLILHNISSISGKFITLVSHCPISPPPKLSLFNNLADVVSQTELNFSATVAAYALSTVFIPRPHSNPSFPLTAQHISNPLLELAH